MSGEKLLPCPFCGGDRVRSYKGHKGPQAQCLDCGASGIKASVWNTRASGWQPIETAPEEQRVWLFIPSFPAPANQMMVGLRWRGDDFWTVEHVAVRTVGGRSSHKPTHWMPLPPTPQGEGA